MSAKVSRPLKKRRAISRRTDDSPAIPRASTAGNTTAILLDSSDASPAEDDPSMVLDASPSPWEPHAAAQEGSLPDQTNLSLIIMDVLDHSNFFEQCFVEKFVESSTSSRLGMNPVRPRSWVFALPSLLSDAQTPSVRFSIRAASLIYFAVVQHNKSAEVEAVRWYLAGLASHRGFIQGSNTDANSLRHGSTPISPEISVPMMFLYFETMKRTSPDAWAHHIAAAVTTVEALGPDHYRVGQDHAMFRSLRTYAAFKALLKNDLCSFASQEWCEAPFTDSTKIEYEFLIDILLAIPHHLLLTLVPGGDFRDSIDKIASLNYSDEQTLERETLVILQRLQNWWWHFTRDTSVVAGQPATTDLIQAAPDPLMPPSLAGQYVFPDTLTAKTVSLYDSLMVIVYSVLASLEECKSPSPEGVLLSPLQRYRSEIERHSSSVLMAAWYQNWRHPYCGDALRTGFSVKIVSWLGANAAQKDEARRMMVLWGMESTITAI
ncbi:hypothetical protein AYO20_06973 [Fonsecaea nubica]|uniref:Transcription factor domain-containing protein n=1 Tax=Fonsecaea nubica TaxID=856822 RepID=A0A178CWH1_9EURO|nr:hypothetical protein AYO20_06973 [Fonsecaea nubica]OAL33797.1 hypothetical protein AYO20_06973 [Fonsecaea nubica]